MLSSSLLIPQQKFSKERTLESGKKNGDGKILEILRENFCVEEK